MNSLSNYIANFEASGALISLILDRNDICNEGLRDLANGLFERFNVMDIFAKSHVFTENSISSSVVTCLHMPLDNLSLSNTAFTHYGF